MYKELNPTTMVRTYFDPVKNIALQNKICKASFEEEKDLKMYFDPKKSIV